MKLNLNKINWPKALKKSPKIKIENLKGSKSAKFGALTGGLVSALGVVVMAFTATSYLQTNKEYSEKIQTATDMVALSGSVTKDTLGAVRGETKSLGLLEQDSKKFTTALNKFVGIGVTWSLETDLTGQYKKLANEWNITNNKVNSILSKKEDLSNLKDRVERAEGDLTKIDRLISRFVQESQGKFNDIESVQAKVWLDSVRTILLNAVSLQGRDEVSPELAFRIAKNMAYVNEVLASFEKGNAGEEIRAAVAPEQKAVLTELKKFLKEGGAEANLSLLAKSINDVQEAKIEGSQVNNGYPSLLKEVDVFLSQLKDKSDGMTAQWAISFLGGLLFVVLGVALILYANALGEKNRTKEKQKENEENIRAVHQLLEEIQGLGAGDLTKRATTGNGVTNEIALALNSTVEDLRRLVSNVRSTTIDVSSQAKNTGELSQALVKQAYKQESEVDEVSKSMTRISQELDKVAQTTAQSSDLAASASDLSQRGELVVKSTIDGMNSIRDTIQETAKRIKSLGESSQEIGQVTQLIREVGSKIQVLALNAAIQSADAGEAGKGFAVVAEEVQALADEAAASAQKIDRLVQNIQGSAKEAIETMEVATSRVVQGTQTADNAGEALRQIGKAANELRALVDDVTDQMQQESENTTDLVFKMSQVKSFTTATREGMDKFKDSMTGMADQTKVLKDSVDGFRLDGNQ